MQHCTLTREYHFEINLLVLYFCQAVVAVGPSYNKNVLGV